MLFFNWKHRLGQIFSNFNRRSDQETQFFLPGYSILNVEIEKNALSSGFHSGEN